MLHFLSLLSSLATAAIINVNSNDLVQKANQAGWQVRDHWVNHLPAKEVKRLLGAQLVQKPGFEFESPESFVRSSRESLDWRNKNGANYVTPVLNQANCGSCVAFAAVATIETQMNVSSGIPGLNTRLSPQALFACGGGLCDWGWRLEEASRYLVSKGVPDEACAPYVSGATGQDTSCKAICPDAAARSVRPQSYNKPTNWMKNVEAVKKALANGPLMTSMTVYADFMVYGGGVYKHVKGDALGGHAVSIIGFDDAKHAWIVRNSWGEDWGDKGFFMIDYDDASEVGIDTFAYVLPPVNGYVSLQTPKNYTYTTGQVTLSGFSTFKNTAQMTFVLQDDRGKALWTANCNDPSMCQSQLNTTNLPDGQYTMTLTATNGSSTLGSSNPQIFYVANNKPKLGLSFTAGFGMDFSKPVSGRITFDIQTSSSSVPMSELTFYYKDASGQNKGSRTTYVVLPKMSSGWRTPTVPNGQYEIWMVGKVKTNAFETSVETAHQTITVTNK